MKGDVPKQALADAMRAVKEKLAADKPKESRPARPARLALESLIPALPEMIGGSADLTGSNNTRTKGMKAIHAGDFSGRYIHYGVREHGMAAAMNGMALHGGIVPYCGTFLVFSDYCRPAIRLAALMGTAGHPCDDPRLHRPRRRRTDAPAGRASCRASGDPESAGVPPVRRCRNRRMLAAGARGQQTGRASLRSHGRTCRSCAAGSTTTISARTALMRSRVRTAARMSRSLPPVPKLRLRSTAQSCWRSTALRRAWSRCPASNCSRSRARSTGAPSSATHGVKVGVEAAVRQGWDAIIGSDGIFIGMNSFGASAPYKELYKKFGITAEAIAAAAIEKRQ